MGQGREILPFFYSSCRRWCRSVCWPST